MVVTDLDEKEANAPWYQMRFWIEDEYKDHKSGGWGWQQTKMTDPGRAQRQWLERRSGHADRGADGEASRRQRSKSVNARRQEN